MKNISYSEQSSNQPRSFRQLQENKRILDGVQQPSEDELDSGHTLKNASLLLDIYKKAGADFKATRGWKHQMLSDMSSKTSKPTV